MSFKKPSQLNVVIKITAPNGWRTEWDMEYAGGAPTWVTMTRFSPENVVSIQPGPVRLRAEHWFDEFFKHWVGDPQDTPESK